MSNTSEKLSGYFAKLGVQGKEIPYITVIAKESGVSPASITRYVKSRGHYSFASMRADYNKNIDEKTIFDVKRISRFIQRSKGKKILLSSSLTTEFMLPFLTKTLNNAGFKVDYIRDYNSLDYAKKAKEYEICYFITITGESNRFIKYIASVPKTKAYVITTEKNLETKYPNVIRPSRIIVDTSTYISKNATIIGLLEYLNRIISYLYAVNRKE